MLEKFPEMKNLDLASKVSTKKTYRWKNGEKNYLDINQIKKKFIAVIDFGIKKNILRLLESKNYDVILFPINFSYKKILSLNPAGIFLSNGPGDPKATFNKFKKELQNLKKLNVPTFGICLGHQILSLLFGARTEKMHHGHRGANHPIKNHSTKNVEITVQNHGFVVSEKGLPKNIKITHSSLFDNTIAGIEIENKPFFFRSISP